MDNVVMAYLNLLDATDTRAVSNIAILAGIVLSIGALTTVPKRFRWVFHAYSLMYISFSLILTWTYYYNDARENWQLWPPHLALIIAVDLLMLIRIVRCLWIRRYVYHHKTGNRVEDDDSIYH